MTSEARLKANRRNGARGRGAVTERGKSRVSANAVTHAVTARKHIPEQLQKQIQERKEGLIREYAPSSESQKILIEQLAHASIMLLHTYEQMQIQIAADALRALTCWDDDRRVQALDLAARLPKDPERVAARLRQTQQGAHWLLDKLTVLEESYKSLQSWDDTQRQLACHLLGMAAPDETSDRPWPSNAELAELIADERAELQRVVEALAPSEEAYQMMAEHGIPVDPSPALRRLHRYVAMHIRQLNAALRALNAEPAAADAHRVGHCGGAPSVSRPVVLVPKLGPLTLKPDPLTLKPDPLTLKPAASVSQPAASAPKPAVSVSQPAVSAPKPAPVRAQPVVPQSTIVCKQPEQPVASGKPQPYRNPWTVEKQAKAAEALAAASASGRPQVDLSQVRNPRKRREMEKLRREGRRRAAARAAAAQNKPTCQNGSRVEDAASPSV
jgi:hypothetical protein